MTDCTKVTLYTGGHKGAEAEFLKLADTTGINKVIYSFEGHNAACFDGAQILNSEELKKGDISMEIISKLMGRTYSKADKIRKVIQSIFHMVNSGYHVVAIGWIQPDGTVKGGTGWGVELAKLFNRPLSVFDQDKKGWFSWKDKQWVEDSPIITTETFAGTGTRNLTDDGCKALRDLFERSFCS
ncbi:MAG: hypothetical protein K9L30_05810 [Desulfobacterales bacterium]|nr:hypothetical protein [Desulfobacterales bacterium]